MSKPNGLRCPRCGSIEVTCADGQYRCERCKYDGQLRIVTGAHEQCGEDFFEEFTEVHGTGITHEAYIHELPCYSSVCPCFLEGKRAERLPDGHVRIDGTLWRVEHFTDRGDLLYVEKRTHRPEYHAGNKSTVSINDEPVYRLVPVEDTP